MGKKLKRARERDVRARVIREWQIVSVPSELRGKRSQSADWRAVIDARSHT
jgi:hypothetical protein